MSEIISNGNPQSDEIIKTNASRKSLDLKGDVSRETKSSEKVCNDGDKGSGKISDVLSVHDDVKNSDSGSSLHYIPSVLSANSAEGKQIQESILSILDKIFTADKSKVQHVNEVDAAAVISFLEEEDDHYSKQAAKSEYKHKLSRRHQS